MTRFNKTSLEHSLLDLVVTTSPNISLSLFTRILFLLFSVFVAAPFIDIPLLGLSITAPLFALICFDLYLSPRKIGFKPFALWLIIIYFFGIGLTLSLFGNLVFTPQYLITGDDITQLIRYAYWLLVFFTTAVIIALTDLGKTTVIVLGITVVGVGLLRLYDGLAFSNFGLDTELLTKNVYGIQFSIFSVCGVYLYFSTKKSILKILYIILYIILLLSIILNFSRGSWVGVGVSTSLFLTIYIFTQRKFLQANLALFLIPILISLAIILFPQDLLNLLNARIGTFQQLEEDASFVTREVMVQKSLTIFNQNPLFGAGLRHFTTTDVDLIFPSRLRGRSVVRFNNFSAHNSYGALLAETGLSGMLPYLCLVGLLATRGLIAVISLARNGETWPIPIYAAMIGMSIHFWSITGLGSTGPWFIYGIVCGIITRSQIVTATPISH